ncbi:MAG: hypothetical protein WBQ23_05820 [Bacteroidota bacterium]
MRWFILILFAAVVAFGCSSSDLSNHSNRKTAVHRLVVTAPGDSIWIVKGRILDRETGEPMIGAWALIQYRISGIDSVFKIGAYANPNANFTILIHSKQQPMGMTLRTRYQLYKNQSLELSDFNDGAVLDIKDINLDVDPDWWNNSEPKGYRAIRPMIDREQTNFKSTVTQEQIENLPVR